MTVFFRTDSSSHIGSGHVMRCLTLAKALRAKGAVCHFVCRAHSGNLIEVIRQSGFAVTSLPASVTLDNSFERTNSGASELPHSHWLGVSQENDADDTLRAIGSESIDLLVVDHYGLDYRWEEKLRQCCRRIMVIDDLADRRHDCDVLLDQNQVQNMNHRYMNLIPDSALCLVGPSWALLQPEYTKLHPNTPPRCGRVRKILVYFGGADRQNLTGLSIDAFLALQREDILLDVVVHSGSPFFHSVEDQVKGHTNITFHHNLPSLAPLMLQADLAIGAGGATSWERCCLGLPALIVTLAENQKPIAKALHEGGYVMWLGDQCSITRDHLTEQMNHFLNREDLRAWSERCLSLVTGQGTRLVGSLLDMDESVPIVAAIASFGAYNYFSEAYTEEDFSGMLRNPLGSCVCTMKTQDGIYLGAICFEKNGDWWSVSDVFCSSLSDKFRLRHRFLREGIAVLRQQQEGVVSLQVDDRQWEGTLDIAVCTDSQSWMNQYIPELLEGWIQKGHRCRWSHDAENLPSVDLCFYLSYSKIVGEDILSRSRNNLVVHESDLPKGKGWSPLTWQILDGENHIPVTLIEAESAVDSGCIYGQIWIRFDGSELVHELRRQQAETTMGLCRNFVEDYPESAATGLPQVGEGFMYPRRRPKDSQLDARKSIEQQFNLLRVVDNERYPAYFSVQGKKYKLKIEAY